MLSAEDEGGGGYIRTQTEALIIFACVFINKPVKFFLILGPLKSAL